MPLKTSELIRVVNELKCLECAMSKLGKDISSIRKID